MPWSSAIASRLTLFGEPARPRPSARRSPDLMARAGALMAKEAHGEIPGLFWDARHTGRKEEALLVDAFAADVAEAGVRAFDGLSLAEELKRKGWFFRIPRDVETLDDTEYEALENWTLILDQVEREAARLWVAENGIELLIEGVTRARRKLDLGWAFACKHYRDVARVVFAPDTELLRFVDQATGELRGGLVVGAEEIEIDPSSVFPRISLAAA